MLSSIIIITLLGNLYLFGGYDVQGVVTALVVGIAVVVDIFSIVYAIKANYDKIQRFFEGENDRDNQIQRIVLQMKDGARNIKNNLSLFVIYALRNVFLLLTIRTILTVFNRYLFENFYRIVICMCIYIPIGFLYYISAYRKNRKLIKRINAINKRVEKAISTISIELLETDSKKCRKAYNKILKKVIKILKKEKQYLVLDENIFDEDIIVIHTLNLFKKLDSEKNITAAYADYKRKFKKANEFKFPPKAKKGVTKETCVSNMHDLRERLVLIRKTNNIDIAKLKKNLFEYRIYSKFNIKEHEKNIKRQMVISLLYFIGLITIGVIERIF